MRILIVDNDERIVSLISRGLIQEGYAVDSAFNADQAENLVDNYPFDIIILDLMMSGRDGIMVCESLRHKKIKTPILILATKDNLQDLTEAMDNWADDYLTKPFIFQELCVRIRALLRRGTDQLTARIQAGDLIIDTAKKMVWLKDREIDLTMKEYCILEYLACNRGSLVSHQKIEQHVWNTEIESGSNTVEVYITKLRAKLDGGRKDSLIKTVWGAGYRFLG
jgi:two-component system, OmpR family, copper resistance phosphate regulon response regulator CusR